MCSIRSDAALFEDAYLDVPFDLGDVLWIVTATDAGRISLRPPRPNAPETADTTAGSTRVADATRAPGDPTHQTVLGTTLSCNHVCMTWCPHDDLAVRFDADRMFVSDAAAARAVLRDRRPTPFFSTPTAGVLLDVPFRTC